MAEEVRYQMLRPAQVVARRKACPVAYVPIGTLEWHGVHNPLGADTLQAEGFAVRCAQAGGGLAFPSLYYGENRNLNLMEANAQAGPAIAEQMELPFENFSPDRMPFSAAEQLRNYHKLLLHILAEVQSLGFAVGVLVAGHYPLIGLARSAVLEFHHHNGGLPNRMLAWAFTDYLLVREQYPDSGDHAAGWETSHLMAMHGETVDLNTLGPRGEPVVGVDGSMPPHDASAEYGEQIIAAAVEVAVAEVRHRLQHPKTYLAHGQCLHEGLWKQ